MDLDLSLLKRESCPTLTKYYWLMQLISHGQSSSLKASFEIELGPLDFNMVSESSLRYWADLFPIMVHVFDWSVTREKTHLRESFFSH